MSKIYPVKMKLSYILALFSANNKIKFIKSENEYTLFEVFSLKNAKELEELLLSNSNTKRKMITNNQGKKPLVMSVEFKKIAVVNMWRFKIYQKGSKGIILDTFQTIDSIPVELQTFLRPLEEGLKNSNDLNGIKTHFEKKLRNIQHDAYLLCEDDLKFFLLKEYLTQFEIKQVTRTYIFYKDYYDFYTGRIDDYAREMKARESNKGMEKIILVCEELIKKHSKLELLLNEKGEVWKYKNANQDYSWFVLFFYKKVLTKDSKSIIYTYLIKYLPKYYD